MTSRACPSRAGLNGGKVRSCGIRFSPMGTAFMGMAVGYDPTLPGKRTKRKGAPCLFISRVDISWCYCLVGCK